MEDAHRRCTALIKTQPENVDAHYLMGLIFERAQDFGEAVKCFQEVLELDPKHIGSLVNVGGLLTSLGRSEEAIDPLRKALKMDRDIFPARYNLARALNMTGNLQQAAREANRAWALNPEAGEVQFLIGEIYADAEEVHKSIDAFRKCLEKLPDHLLANIGLAKQLYLIGKFDEGRKHVKKVLEHAPDHPMLHVFLSNTVRSEEEEAESLRVFLSALDSPHMIIRDRAQIHFSAASILDRQKNFDDAFHHYKMGNDLRYEEFPFNREKSDRFFESLINTYTKDFFKAREGWGSESEKPVFIVGMPRSGTTLAEQKLAAHPDVFGMGEVRSFVYLAENLPDDITAVENFAGFDRKTVLAAAKKYLTEIPSEGQSHLRAVNKLPGNYQHLGVIATLFPNAKIIHCRRNILDVGFSCFQQNFKVGNLRFTTNLDDLALILQQYLETMEHYRDVLPVEIFELNYEEMVADTDYWTNAMYEFVGVDPARAAEEKKGKTQMVKTASLWQVRQPVYKTSVEKWRNYEKHLADFAKKLGVETAA